MRSNESLTVIMTVITQILSWVLEWPKNGLSELKWRNLDLLLSSSGTKYREHLILTPNSIPLVSLVGSEYEAECWLVNKKDFNNGLWLNRIRDKVDEVYFFYFLSSSSTFIFSFSIKGFVVASAAADAHQQSLIWRPLIPAFGSIEKLFIGWDSCAHFYLK